MLPVSGRIRIHCHIILDLKPMDTTHRQRFSKHLTCFNSTHLKTPSGFYDYLDFREEKKTSLLMNLTKATQLESGQAGI